VVGNMGGRCVSTVAVRALQRCSISIFPWFYTGGPHACDVVQHGNSSVPALSSLKASKRTSSLSPTPGPSWRHPLLSSGKRCRFAGRHCWRCTVTRPWNHTDDGCADCAQVNVHGDMLGAVMRSARPQAGVLAARIHHHVAYTCRNISTPAAATASAAVQHRPATQQAYQLTADAQRPATAPEHTWPAAQLSQVAEPAATAAPAAASAGHLRPHATDPRLASGTFIKDLRIRDFALVEDQLIHLAPGLNVITGESGAGKSVLVEAFASILGAPAPDDCVRPPSQAAVVEGTVQLSPAALVCILFLLHSFSLGVTRSLLICCHGRITAIESTIARLNNSAAFTDLRRFPGLSQRVIRHSGGVVQAHVNELLVSLGVPKRGLISEPAASSNGSNGSHAAAPAPELRLRREIRREASGALRRFACKHGQSTRSREHLLLCSARYQAYCSSTRVAGLLRRPGCQEVPLCAEVHVCLQSMLCQRRCHVTARATRGGRRSRGRERPALGAVAKVPCAVLALVKRQVASCHPWSV